MLVWCLVCDSFQNQAQMNGKDMRGGTEQWEGYDLHCDHLYTPIYLWSGNTLRLNLDTLDVMWLSGVVKA